MTVVQGSRNDGGSKNLSLRVYPWRMPATQNVRNFLTLRGIIGLFEQSRPEAHWCERARLRVWFRLSVA